MNNWCVVLLLILAYASLSSDESGVYIKAMVLLPTSLLV